MIYMYIRYICDMSRGYFILFFLEFMYLFINYIVLGNTFGLIIVFVICRYLKLEIINIIIFI